MGAFEEVITSVLQTYLTNQKHTAMVEPTNNLEIITNHAAQLLTITLNLPGDRSVHAELHFSSWTINSTITTDKVSTKTVLEFTEMIEALISNFAIVYKNVKW